MDPNSAAPGLERRYPPQTRTCCMRSICSWPHNWVTVYVVLFEKSVPNIAVTIYLSLADIQFIDLSPVSSELGVQFSSVLWLCVLFRFTWFTSQNSSFLAKKSYGFAVVASLLADRRELNCVSHFLVKKSVLNSNNCVYVIILLLSHRRPDSIHRFEACLWRTNWTELNWTELNSQSQFNSVYFSSVAL